MGVTFVFKSGFCTADAAGGCGPAGDAGRGRRRLGSRRSVLETNRYTPAIGGKGKKLRFSHHCVALTGGKRSPRLHDKTGSGAAPGTGYLSFDQESSRPNSRGPELRPPHAVFDEKFPVTIPGQKVRIATGN